MANSLTEFLHARIAEDEAVARSAMYEPDPDYPVESDDPWGRHGEFAGRGGVLFTHVLHNNPARVLSECAGKRAIVELHEDAGPVCFGCEKALPCPTLQALAAVYADHPDYLPEWTA